MILVRAERLTQKIDTPLSALHRALILSLGSVTPDDVMGGRFEVRRLVDSDELLQSRMLVNYGYTLRYVRDGGKVYVPAHTSKKRSEDTTTYGVQLPHNGQMPVLQTMQVARGQAADVTRFFQLPENSNNPIVELGKFATHPIFELLVTEGLEPEEARARKVELLQAMVEIARDDLLEEGIERVHMILSPSILRFVNDAGLNPRRVHDAVPTSTAYSRRIRRMFAGYWKPDSPVEKQPQVYTLQL